jgi:hypothetical protein
MALFDGPRGRVQVVDPVLARIYDQDDRYSRVDQTPKQANTKPAPVTRPVVAQKEGEAK